MANCTRPRGPLDADNDIVGPGALSAFFTSAAITYLTVILAYVTDTLDKDLINPFDAKVVEMTRKLLFRSKPKTQMQDLEPGANNAVATQPDHHPDTGKKVRKDAISNFLISLSDQQLVTGLAVLVAAVSGQQSLTGYDFSVATCLGWFSCTTHLTTIDVLCVRFKKHGLIKHVRVAGLVCLMGLLSYAFIRTTSISSFSIPIDCPRNAPSVDYYDILCLLPLWVDYFSAVRKIYLGPPTSFWDVTELKSSRYKGPSGGESSRVDQLTVKKKERQSQEILGLIEKSEEHARSRLGLLFYDGSFLETFPDMTYSFCFGIAQVVVYRWDSPELSEESTEMGFGQITALLLLLLPFLAIGEAWTSYSGASRRGMLPGEETDLPGDSPGKFPDKANHGVEGDLEKPRASCPKVAGSAEPQQSGHLSTRQSSAATAGSSHQGIFAGVDITGSLERTRSTRSNVLDAGRGSNGEKDAGGAVSDSQNLKDVEDLKHYFPMSMEELSTLDDEGKFRIARQSFLRRCKALKIAENNLDLRQPLAFFGLHLSIGVVASVFLNSYDDRLQLAGTILNIVSVVLGNLKSVRRLFRLLKEIKERRTKI